MMIVLRVFSDKFFCDYREKFFFYMGNTLTSWGLLFIDISLLRINCFSINLQQSDELWFVGYIMTLNLSLILPHLNDTHMA